MSGGGGGIIIIGDDPLVKIINDHINLVANFRKERAKNLILLYGRNESAITHEDQQFLLRCAADIVDNS